MKPLLSAIVTLFFLGGCSSHLYPLETGKRWTYVVSQDETSREVTNQVEEKRTVDGRDWFRLVEYGDTFWVANGEDGQIEAVNFFDRTPAPDEKAEIVLMFKYPAEPGETWEKHSSPTTYLGKKKRTVPAGTFRCHEYRIDMQAESYSLSCIAIGVGVVYNEFVNEDGEKMISRLKEYR